jgi:MSHA biogenesis protein MshN
MIDPASIAAKAGARDGSKHAASDDGGGKGTASGRNGLVDRRTETPARREKSATAASAGKPRKDATAAREKRVAGKPAGAGAAATKAPAPVPGGATGDASPQQRATVLFQRAQARLVEARVGEAIVNLEAALQIDPQHEAARQTLASLLVENGRHADAMRHLQQGLALDPRQTGMAMLLARLQLEHGGPAIDTLQTSLPYAQSNADYRALFAGILQRAGRHKEAVEHYTAAVQLQPQQGVWWMGLGISLHAEQRNAEAKAALTRARDSGRLSPELQNFVERKLQQVSVN